MTTEVQFITQSPDAALKMYNIKEINYFSNDGYLRERIALDDKGFDYRKVYIYSNNHNTLTIRNIGEDSSLLFTNYYQYDQSGHLLESGEFKIIDGIRQLIYNEVRIFDDGGSMQSYKYTKEGKENSVLLKNTYDSEDRLILSIHQEEGALTQFEENAWKYDSNNHVTEEKITTYDERGKEKKTVRTFKYNAAGQLMEESDHKGKYLVHTQYTYDTNGEYKTIHTDDPTLPDTDCIYTYTLDKQGNWIKMIMASPEGKIFATMIRVIQYFP